MRKKLLSILFTCSIFSYVLAQTAPPTVVSPVVYCQNDTAVALTANGNQLNWYTNSSGGSALPSAPVPQTLVPGDTVFYVSQTIGGIESLRDSITVTIHPSPAGLGVKRLAFCQGIGSIVLTPSGPNIQWYSKQTGGVTFANAPTVNMAIADTIIYYVSQTSNGCKSLRDSVIVVINPTPSTPVSSSPVQYCLHDGADALTANGTSLLWYTDTSAASGTAPVPLTTIADTSYYYVIQMGVGECASAPDTIMVIVHPLPQAIITAGSSITFCAGGGSVLLTASTGNSFSWINGTQIIGTNQTYTASVAGNYSVLVTDSLGCSDTSSVIVVTTTAPLTWYADEDGDGYGDPNLKLKRCTKPFGYVSNNSDDCPFDPNKIAPGNCGCGNTEQSCLDCAGVPNGSAVKDSCGNCVGGTTGLTACIITTGTVQVVNLSSYINIYPQPFDYSTKIEMKNGSLINSISIYSASGNLVYTKSSIQSSLIETGDNLSPGFYTLIIQTGQGNYSTKIVKVK